MMPFAVRPHAVEVGHLLWPLRRTQPTLAGRAAAEARLQFVRRPRVAVRVSSPPPGVV